MRSIQGWMILAAWALCLAPMLAQEPETGKEKPDESIFRCGPCYALFQEGRLTIGNAEIERIWEARDGLLHAVSFRDLKSGVEWIDAATTASAAPLPSVAAPVEARALHFIAKCGTLSPVEEPSLLAELTAEGKTLNLVYTFQIFSGSRGVLCQLSTGKGGGGGETPQLLPGPDVLEDLSLTTPTFSLTQVTLRDKTDEVGDDLVVEKTWSEPTSGALSLKDNIFYLDDAATSAGLLFLKHAPLPDSRPQPSERDASWDSRSRRFQLLGHGTRLEHGKGYRWVVLAYRGGAAGRIATLQQYWRQLRKYDPARDVLALSNTWGDRSRDSRVNEAFMTREINAGTRLGVEIVQIDDGWQRGRTKNSAERVGVWEGFWAADPNFWDPDPGRFPRGLTPLEDVATTRGLKLGLWYGIDSFNHMENAPRDAEKILELHRKYDIRYFKFDAVDLVDRVAERNFSQLLQQLVDDAEGAVVVDLDVTAMRRPGYLGLPAAGPIFVENRYTDIKDPARQPKAYWPHKTLRNFWELAHYVDPVRLRMEFLNNARNAANYGDDPLAPARYTPSYLFATVMFASPLAWFEVSNLPEAYVREVTPLIAVWKEHRERVWRGRIIPVGDAPSGHGWTGFVSVQDGIPGAYVLMFRELNDRAEWSAPMPLMDAGAYQCQALAGEGSARLAGGVLSVRIPKSQSFFFGRMLKQ